MPFIAVHAGAGKFNEEDVKELKSVCRLACDKAMVKLKDGCDVSEAITVAISALENSPLTNCGTGSCLTYKGTAECDASIINGKGDFASVGAVSGVKNPIVLAHQLLLNQSKGLMSLGRIPPMCLCGDGAHQWAIENGVPVCNPDDLITEEAKEVYLDHIERLRREDAKEGSEQCAAKRRKVNDSQSKLDTVGAVCIDANGLIGAGVSSGGISLKHTGRIGQAGVYRCGCWAKRHSDSSQIASSASGVGEYLIKTQLAKEITTSLVGQSVTIQNAFHQTFLDNVILAGCNTKEAGVLVLHVSPSGSIELSWVHSTDDMLIAYNSNDKSKSFMSQLEEKAVPGIRTTAGWLSF
ncbi:PREDICTED: threonine aspartase 1-like [Amphimedon queenslandica]|uniref:Threonine aspartase 1 n=1 Tax=Amphimedon queenslandica TaxID=400682 RepID=A0A1X7UX32_AMPQE|nr:PREDICTED: threonine aspartase 1-like [Amphimedon queenslandica]|eukprot:XP_003386439.1 PREDICTED: threonine aspartase 1-like [Amphimedon queenslandica]